MEKLGKTWISYLSFTNLSTGVQAQLTCQYSWKCCICCPWLSAGRPGLYGDSPRQRCHYRAQQVHCLHCTGKSWSFLGDPRRGLWQQSVLPPHPADQGFPGVRGRQGWTLPTGYRSPSLIPVSWEGLGLGSWGYQTVLLACWAFSDFLEAERLPRTHRTSSVCCGKWKFELQLQWTPQFSRVHSPQFFCGKKPSGPF